MGGVTPVLLSLLSLALCVRAQDVAREPPTILEPTTRSQKFVKGGEDVILQCRAKGIPNVVYEWLWNDNTISSTVITYDANTGKLQIKGITEREEGFFNCKAKNTYQGQEAVTISHKIEVRIARVGEFPPYDGSQKVFTFTEGQYVKLPCDEKMPIYYGPTTFKWYTPKGSILIEVTPDQRKFIDQEGALHFAYIERADENINGNKDYKCAMSNTIQGLIKLGTEKQVSISSAGGSIPEKKPLLEYSSSGKLLTVERNKDAILECVFSGYENAGTKVPSVKWFDNENHQITTSGRYSFENYGRTLRIRNVVEADEKAYFCQGDNVLGSARGQLILNVTSSPIWVEPLKSLTIPENEHAEFTCVARSAMSETPPGPPEWYKNGARMISGQTDPTKYQWSDNNRKMTVKYVSKTKDIACFQCYVENSVGREFSDACLNVILPITVTVQPTHLEQEISKGDTVNLTVVAVSDPLVTLQYRWIFKNMTYESQNAPPRVTYDSDTMLAYLNTSELTDEEYAMVDGVYRREIYHQYQSVFVDVTVTRKEAPPGSSTEADRHDVNCTDTRMVFSVPLQDRAAHAQSATLRDPRCRLDTGGARATGSIDLNACGTTAAFTDNSVIFRNAILLSSSGNATDTIPIQCTYGRFQNVQLNYMPLVRNVLFTEAGVGQVSFRIQQFTDASFSFPVDDSSYPLDIQPGEDVFIQLIGSAVTDEVGVMAQECFVSPYSSLVQARALSTPLIDNGCPASNDVRLLPSAPDDIQHVRFAFRAVTFPSQHSSIVYVHCRVGLCPRDICLQPAARNCPPNQRFRRTLAADARSDVGSHQLSTGPFLVQASAGATTPSTAVVMAAVSMVVAVMATVVAMVAVVAWRRSRSNAKYSIMSSQ